MSNYESYRDVQSFWMDKAPSHWKSLKNKHVFTQKKEIVGENWKSFTLLTMGKGGVKPRDMDGGGKFPESFEGYQVVNPKQLVFCLFDLDETPRTVGLSKDHGMITSAYDVFSTTKGNDPQYWTYFYQTIDDHKGLRPYYTGLRKVVRYDTFMGIEIFSPPFEEQHRISRYLDKKTQQIDSLINKIEKKIELLKEQRTSLINQYVTKGLEPNVEMKDSGVEWIGEIPKHWVTTKLKYVSEVTLGKMLTPEDKGDMILQKYLRSVNIQEDRLELDDLNEMWFSIHEIEKLSIRAGDIFMNEGGQVGRPCFIKNDLDGVGFQNSLNRVRSKKLDGYYLYALILSGFKHGYYDSIVDRVSIPHLTKEKLENTFALRPPINEQKEIAKNVLVGIQSFDFIIQKELQRSRLLSEYRQSLISSVVTGKVRVTEDMV